MKRNYMVVDATNKVVSDYFANREDAKVVRNELQGELAPHGGAPREDSQHGEGKPSGRDRRESWKVRVSYGPDHWRNAS